MSDIANNKGIDRRGFLKSTAAAGVSLTLAQGLFAGVSTSKPRDLNVALLGAGTEGQVLMGDCLRIPGIRFKAVCDIWEKYNLKRAYRILLRHKQPVNKYVDYRDMLAKEKDLDAVIIATPDFMHAEHTNACLEAGLHVYCEKEMSNDLEKAKSMVLTARKTGKLLQIGHQRRSNPRYITCKKQIIDQYHIPGRITHINAQWNRGISACQDRGFSPRIAIPESVLKKYGYESMHQFRNWRWYRRLGGGPIVDLGSHQIDIFAWFLNAQPKTVFASGGRNYYKNREWFDNVLAIYEYETSQGLVRAFYETLTTTSNLSYSESFMGDQGTLCISERASVGQMLREPSAPDWDKWAKKGLLRSPEEEPKPEKAVHRGVADVRESPPLPKWDLTVELDKPVHQPHLENFFAAVRANDKSMLNCPAEVGYETAVAVLRVNKAVEARKILDFKESDFKV